MTRVRRGTSTSARRRAHDDGSTFVEMLVAIVLLGTVVIATLAAVRATVIGSRTERDHARAQQWLQSAIGVIDQAPYQDCVNASTGGDDIELAYQNLIDANVTTPVGFDPAQIDVLDPEVWSGLRFVAWPGTYCADDVRLTQQKLTIEVASPDGTIIESVEMVKRDD